MIQNNKHATKKSPCQLTDLPKFTGSISYSFSPYLKPYIKS